MLPLQATRGPCTCRWRITVEMEVDKQRWRERTRACDSDQQHALLGPGHGALVLCRKLSSSTRGAGMRNMVAGCACERLGPTQLLLLRRAIACSGSEKPPWVFAAGFGVEAQHLFTLACRGRTTLLWRKRSGRHGNARTSARAASPPRHLLSGCRLTSGAGAQVTKLAQQVI